MLKAMRRVAMAFRVFFPRNWWFPQPRLERLRKFDTTANEEYTTTIRRAMYTLLTVALFCLLTTLGASDVSLLEAAPTIKVPFADVPISFAGFLVTAPLILFGVTLYLHIFLGHWLELEESRRQSEPPVEGIPTLFYLDDAVPRLLTALTFYWLTPLVLAVMTWKAAARIEWGPPLAVVTALASVALAILEIRRCPEKPRGKWWDLWVPRLVIVTVATVAVLEQGVPWFHRPLDLVRADLSGKWLVGADLRQADLRSATLTKATLEWATFVNADLRSANLTGANLRGAELWDASLFEANLTGANLSGANLRETDFTAADLTNVKCLTRGEIAVSIGASISGLPARNPTDCEQKPPPDKP